MDTHQLEALLDGGEETDSIEFKGAMAWDKNSLVKDILAMANVIDGGRIIIGVEDGTFLRQGLTEDQVQTYDLDIMRDQVAPFADPMVQFRCEIVADRDGRRYAILEIASFESTPVICRRNGADVQAGTVYFRSRARRPQSARVDNSTDLREIIETAAARSMQRLRRLGFTAEVPNPYDYEGELGGL
ncbi:MAG: ATP-binding protein [Roseiarcus sp.]|jgi:predicted HTH transcriptional regulator